LAPHTSLSHFPSFLPSSVNNNNLNLNLQSMGYLVPPPQHTTSLLSNNSNNNNQQQQQQQQVGLGSGSGSTQVIYNPAASVSGPHSGSFGVTGHGSHGAINESQSPPNPTTTVTLTGGLTKVRLLFFVVIVILSVGG
jgi:hypothetical protein